jgi:hypothetical protein
MSRPAIALAGILLVISLSAAVVPAAPAVRSLTSHALDAVILVADRFEAAEGIEKWVDTHGGYLISRLEDRLLLRVPTTALDGFVQFLESAADEIIRVVQRTDDNGQTLLETEAGIHSKQELFERSLALIDKTDLKTTLEIEAEILSILGDLEELKGKRQKLLAEARLARVQIDFRLEQETLPERLPSAFPWVNAVDFYSLMQEFERK